jgi:hypothetical protein
MPWDVRPPEAEHPLVRLTISGPVDGATLEQAFGGALATCAEHDVWRVLTDLREMSAGHSVVDLFGLVTSMAELGIAAKLREALLPGSDPGTRELAGFFETAAVNRGLRVRVFADEADAVAWLTT